MTDLEILIAFRKARAAGYLRKLTKHEHDCTNTNECDDCPAYGDCNAIVNANFNQSFRLNFKAWAKRTKFLPLSILQQQYPELFI